MLNRAFGSLILHEITAHRIEQFKRERLAGRWRAHGQKGAPNPLRPGTVNRELDTLKSVLSKAVEWRKLVESPARGVKRLKVDNRRTRILTEDEQRRLLEAAPRKMRAMITLALITGARVGELLALRWEHVTDGALTFMETKNGKAAAHSPLAPPSRPSWRGWRGQNPYVFTNSVTEDRYTVNGARHVFGRAVVRAGIRPGRDPAHAAPHGAQPDDRHGIDDYTVMELSGHSSTRMLARYTHPTEARKVEALNGFDVVTRWSQPPRRRRRRQRNCRIC